MKKDEIIKAIKNITEFEDKSSDAKIEHPFSVIGPAGKENDVLRIYAYGGCVGKLKGGNASCELLNRGYFEKHGKDFSAKEKKLAEDWISDSKSKSGSITGKWCNDVIDSKEYLSMTLMTIKDKFQKNTGEDKERNIQMEILSKYINSNKRWCIVDVETGITKDILPDSKVIKKVKKPDLVVFDKIRKQFGIIEMKAFNENVDNLYEHYQLFDEIYKEPETFIKELSRRADVMAEYGILDRLDYDINKTVWYGFLFVKGKDGSPGLTGAQDLVKKYMPRENGAWDVCNDCRFLYIDEVSELKDTGLCYDEMFGIKDFLNL